MSFLRREPPSFRGAWPAFRCYEKNKGRLIAGLPKLGDRVSGPAPDILFVVIVYRKGVLFMKKNLTRFVVYVAVMAAMSVVLRLLGYPQTGNSRYDLGFLPICAAGMLTGPIGGGASYVVADLVGTLAAGQSPFPPITVCKFIFGAILGLFFYKKQVTLPRIVLCVLTITVAVDLVAMPLSLVPLYGNGIWAVMTDRLIQAAIMLPVRVVTIWLMQRYLGKQIAKYRINHSKRM